MVNKPTRLNNTLDLIITNIPARITNLDMLPGISDHEIVSCNVNILPLRRHQPPRWIMQYKKANWPKMTEELQKLLSLLETNPSNDPELLWETFSNELHRLIKIHIPQKKTKKIQRLPYITKEIEKLINIRNRKYKKLKKKQRNFEHSSAKYTSLEVEIKTLKREIQKKIRISHWEYVNSIIDPDRVGNNQYESQSSPQDKPFHKTSYPSQASHRSKT